MAQSEGINIGMLVGAGVGILALAIVFMLGPVISRKSKNELCGFLEARGGQMEEAMPALAADSGWNSSYNTDLKTGSDVWEDLTPFLIIVGLVILAAIILYVIRFVA